MSAQQKIVKLTVGVLCLLPIISFGAAQSETQSKINDIETQLTTIEQKFDALQEKRPSQMDLEELRTQKAQLRKEVEQLQQEISSLLEIAEIKERNLRLEEERRRLAIQELEREPKLYHWLLGVGVFTDLATDTDTASPRTKYCIEAGARFPIIDKWNSLGPFVGYGDKWYGGLNLFIPVVKPTKDKNSGGSWIEFGGIIGKESAAFLGLSLETEHSRLFARWLVGANRPLQFGISYLF